MSLVQILCFQIQVLLLIVPASGASFAAGESEESLPASAAASIGLI